MFSLWREISTSSALNTKMLLLCLSEIIIQGKHQLFRCTIPRVGFPNCWAWRRQFVHRLGGHTFNTIVPPLKWNLALHVSWVSSGCQLWKLTPCTSSERGLGRLLGCVAEFSVRAKAREWDQSWPRVLFQARDLYSVHLFMLLFVLLSCCGPGFLLPSSHDGTWSTPSDTQKESDFFPRCNALP